MWNLIGAAVCVLAGYCYGNYTANQGYDHIRSLGIQVEGMQERSDKMLQDSRKIVKNVPKAGATWIER